MDHQDFYTTIAQVYPVLLLALVWDSRYLENLRTQNRRRRRDDPTDGVLFWTKSRVRAYTVILTLTIVASLGAAILTLAGALADSVALRATLSTSMALTLSTLVVRIWSEVARATASPPS